jgi:putative flippase GtrA
MERSLLEHNLEDPDSSDKQEGPPAPPAPRLPSYHPTAWAFVNRVLDIVDTLTGGRAAWFQRFFMYAFIGGFAALVNMAVFFLVFYVIALPVNEPIHNVIASVLAAEISIMANFVPNDYFTFRHLSGHKRSWVARCMRFHITCVGGILLTFVIQFSISHLSHMQPIFAQAIALILVLFYNFSFHHIFTYRHVKPTARS